MTNLAYDRFKFADDAMLQFFHACRSVALKAVVFSGGDDSLEAVHWRKLVRDRLMLLIKRAIDILQVHIVVGLVQDFCLLFFSSLQKQIFFLIPLFCIFAMIIIFLGRTRNCQ